MKTTAATITDAQIKALRDEALRAGDIMQGAICSRALGLTPMVHDDDVFSRAMDVTMADARVECARVIAEAEAQDEAL